MYLVKYPIKWRFEYPENCNRRTLRLYLQDLATHWEGWDAFPWYLTRTLHRHNDNPPTDWDHLHTRFWICGLAAHLILNAKFINRNGVFDLLIRRRVQFVGILRYLILEQIRWCLLFRKQERLPDCALWGADVPGNGEGLEGKRASFREGVELAIADFVRIMNIACLNDDPDERIAGRPMRSWYKGAHLPKWAEVHVQMTENEDGAVFLVPLKKTAARFVSRRLEVPQIEVEPEVGKQRSEAPPQPDDRGRADGRQEAEDDKPGHEELSQQMKKGFDAIRRERMEDQVTVRKQRESIEDMANGPDRFLAGLQAQLSEKERELFFELIAKVTIDGRERMRTHTEIAVRLGGVSRQAVGSRVRRLFAKHAGLADYVMSIREPGKPKAFSEMSPSERRKQGIDKTYD